MNSILIKTGNLSTETDTYMGRMPHEDESRHQGNVSISQRVLNIARKPSEGRTEA